VGKVIELSVVFWLVKEEEGFFLRINFWETPGGDGFCKALGDMTSKRKTSHRVMESTTTPLADPENIPKEIRRQVSEFMFDIWQAPRNKKPCHCLGVYIFQAFTRQPP